jgi:mRNA-degrading endonuclease RelE of RelBE toxin-antitoxin system
MTTIRATRPRGGKVPVVTADYGVRMSTEIEARMRRCRASVRAAIQKQLGEIAASAGSNRRRAKVPEQKEPPLRFYVYEGYRIAYQLDSETRRVVVLDIQLLAAA